MEKKHGAKKIEFEGEEEEEKTKKKHKDPTID